MRLPVEQVVAPVEVPPPELRLETITLTATGDILMHNTQIWSGQAADGSYAFPAFFPRVSPYIQEGDYSSVCFEAPLAGPESGYTGYPLFNSPDAMAATLKEAGFDLIITAHNHALDRGYDGAMRTLEVLRDTGLDTVGSYASEEDSQYFHIVDIRGVKVGYLAYTYGTNGITLPDRHYYAINYLEPEKIVEDIQALRPQVDILLLVLHWGVEYSPAPTPEQELLARQFLEAGADGILGGHPHVIQTMEIVPVQGKKKFVVYSMGNFIGHQRGLERNSGVVFKMVFTKNFDTGSTQLMQLSYTPTFSHNYSLNGKQQFRVVPVESIINRIEQGQETILDSSDLPVLREVLADTRGRLGQCFNVEVK